MIREERDPESLLRNGKVMESAIVAMQYKVVLQSRRLGVPLVVWRGGKVVEVAAETIQLPGENPTT